VGFLNFSSGKDFILGFEFHGAQKDPLPEFLVAGAAGLPGTKLNNDLGRNHYFCELVQQNVRIILLIWSTWKSTGNYQLSVIPHLEYFCLV
jgi:hypothetical protein